jgi:hypothetical protein
MVWGLAWSEAAPEHVKSADGSEADYPECDYDANLTPLYEAIEERAWIAVNQFLHSGYWPESLFADKLTPEEQSRTWVTRYETRADGSKKVRWSQLPIHAAVIFGAPSVVIQQLVEAFPQSVRCTDDHRMLPLHLAFRHGSDDSVLALFLEEFPEAVNVRGYKGRLPVECAKKGPNPERGAIIQTILMKNKTAWERKKSAQQLKELYCVKEALKIKSQKVAHLETAIREIKSREHKTRKELAGTMTELKAAKIKGKGADNSHSPSDNTSEKLAVRQLVEKLAGLEMATKDLVEKEKSTKKELKKTMAELEATKRMKPTEDQAEQFAKLEKVASKEASLLDRNEAVTDESDGSKEEASASIKSTSNSPVIIPSTMMEAAETSKKAAAEEKASVKEAAVTQKVETDDTTSSKEGAATAEQKAEVKVAGVTQSVETTGIKKVTTEKIKTVAATRVKKATAEQNVEPLVISITPSREEEREKLRQFEEANRALQHKILELEATSEIYEAKHQRAQEDLEAVSVPDQNNQFTNHQTAQMSAIRAEMKVLKANSESTNKELLFALTQLAELKKQRAEQGMLSASRYEAGQATNKKLEKKVTLLELALKQFEEKSKIAKVEMNNIHETLTKDPTVQLTPPQERHLSILYNAIKKLDKNAKKTKMELENAKAELNALKEAEDTSMEIRSKVQRSTQDTEMVPSMVQANKELEEKIAILEATMKQFEDKAFHTKGEMEKAMKALKASDNISVTSYATESNLTKKQKQHLTALEEAMKKLEERANHTRDQLDQALEELSDLKRKQAYNNESMPKNGDKAMKDLAKKVQTLQSAMVGFEVKETKTIQELEKAMRELEAVSSKRFEVLAMTSEHSAQLAADDGFAKEVSKLEKKALKEEKRIAELEEAVRDVITKSGSTKEELETAKKLLEDLQLKQEAKDSDSLTKEEKEEDKQEKKRIKELTKKVSILQAAVIGFEEKEVRTMAELENTMKQLEEITSKRFEVLEKASAIKEKDTEKLLAAGALAEEKVAVLHLAMKELEQNAAKTHEELEKTKLELVAMKTANVACDSISKEVLTMQEGQIKEMNEKISVLHQAVQGFEVKETKTMQELEQTMKQLEELTAKRFEVLQKVAGREIEAAKAAEANKYSQKAAQEEKKVAALEFAMRELESKAYNTKLELERAMKTLEDLEGKQGAREQEVAGVTKEEKQVLRELVRKVADIQEAVMVYDEKEHKTTQELERTKKELEETKRQVLGLHAQQQLDAEIQVIATDDNQSEVEAVEINGAEAVERKEANETAKRVTEETLTSLETAIHRLVEQIGSDEDVAESATPHDIAKLGSNVENLDTNEETAPVVAAPPLASDKSMGAQPVNSFQAAALAKAERPRRSSFFARLYGKVTKPAAHIASKKAKASKKANKKNGFGILGTKKALAKGEPAPTAPLITSDQRKAIEAIHGPEIVAVLTEQQILDIVSQLKETPAPADAPTSAPVETASTIPAFLDAAIPDAVPEIPSIKSKNSEGAASAGNTGIEEEDLNTPTVVSLSSQRSVKSSKSHTSKTSKSHTSKSHKSSGSSNQKNVPASPSNRLSAVSPAPQMEGARKTMEDGASQSDILVSEGTYGDGFEINF